MCAHRSAEPQAANTMLKFEFLSPKPAPNSITLKQELPLGGYTSESAQGRAHVFSAFCLLGCFGFRRIFTGFFQRSLCGS